MILNKDITWAKFEVNNPNVEDAFEDLCGMLFHYKFCRKQGFMHANHNNPGIEIEPILGKDGRTRISYQAKYLAKTGYSKFQKSAEITVKNYEGLLEVVYLYCNQCLTSTSKGYKKIEKTLGDAGIKIVPITNRAIIDEVLEYPIVANAFFNIPMLEKQWYAKQVKGSLDSLGVRFNRNFNVETQMDHYLDVFLANSQGAKVINTQKKEALDSIAGYQRYDKPYVEYIDKACSIIDEIPDVEEKTLSDCMNWENYMIDSFKEELAEIQADREKRSKTQFEDFENEKEYYENLREIQTLERFLAIPELLHISETEQKLLNQRMVIIHGKKGMGKSQLLANLSQTCINEGFPVVLILGGMFLDSSDLQKQLPPVLGLEYDFVCFGKGS